MTAAHLDDEVMFGKETELSAGNRSDCKFWVYDLGYFMINMNQEWKFTQAKIYVKWAIYLPELKDAFTLKGRQNLAQRNTLFLYR